MKYSILGFNQAKLIELQKESGGKILKLDMTDVMLLEYIQLAPSRPSMKHKTDDNNQSYVWISYKKILEDLPILDIKDNMLKKRLNKLTELGLIKSMVFANENCRGSRAYYTITELCESLKYTKDDSEESTECNKLHDEKRPSVINYTQSDRPSVINYTSNNKLNNNTKLNNKNNTNVLLEDKPSLSDNFLKSSSTIKTKQNKYSKCVSMINDYTTDKKLREALINYLNLLLEIDPKIYANQFKGKLNQLARLSNSEKEQIKIVNQSIQYGWKSFYPLKEFTGSNYSGGFKDNIKGDTRDLPPLEECLVDRKF